MKTEQFLTFCKESGYNRVEVKNITGFKEIESALKYEVERQKKEMSEGNIIKHVMGFGKRSHHNSSLLKALHIKPVDKIITENRLSLYNRLFKASTPVLQLQCILLTKYVLNKKLYYGTLIEKLVNDGFNPMDVAFNKMTLPPVPGDNEDDLVTHENFMKPWSNEHIIACLLTKAF